MNAAEIIQIQKHCVDLEHTSAVYKAGDYVQMYNRANKLFDSVSIERMPMEYVTLNPNATDDDRAKSWVRIRFRHKGRTCVCILPEITDTTANAPWQVLIDTAIYAHIEAILNSKP